MHTIGHLIYGVVLTEEANNLIKELKEEGEDSGEHLFTRVYDGNAPFEPGWCGKLYTKFNAIRPLEITALFADYIEKTRLHHYTKESSDMLKIYDLRTYYPDIYKACLEEGWYIVWGTS